MTNSIQCGSGPPVILTHGLAASLHDWDDLLPQLAAEHWGGYALDLLGHGESGKPRDLRAYTVGNVYTHFSGWIDSLVLREPMVLVGHSLGGGLSLMYALRHPQRVRGLVLVNPFYDLKQLPPVLRMMFRRNWIRAGLIARAPYRLFRFFVDLTSYRYDLDVREAHILPKRVREQTARDYLRAAPGIYHIPRSLHGLVPLLSQVTQPALVMWGNRDQTLAPSSFRQIATMLPNVRGARAFQACGHVPHQCHPELFNPPVLDFLKSL